MTSRRDPDARCGSCGVRLSRVDRDHEDSCGDGWPLFQDDPIHNPPVPSGSGGAGAVETAVYEAAPLDAPATDLAAARDAA